jgi:taurine dioxygenase
MRQFEIVSDAAATAARVLGIDLASPIDDATFAAVEAAFDVHGVLVFPGQTITPAQHVAFSRRFGELLRNFNSEVHGVAGYPELFVLSNIEEQGRAIGARRAGETWHSDMCYAACPPRATLLYALEIPELHGLGLGDTEFANTAAAYDALPDAMKRRIASLRAVFDFRGRTRTRGISEEVARRYPPVTHPIVRTHPRTGRKSLYVMRGDCTGIVGMQADEAQRLIEALADHIVRPQFVYRHRWQRGDVVIWDNCTVQHKAIMDYELPQRRLIHRTTVAGPAPA